MEEEQVLKPLELRSLKRSKSSNGVLENIPAVHKVWVDDTRLWMTLDSLRDFTISGQEELWRERGFFVKEDLDFLLGLEYHRFWSRVLYDEKLHEILENWLQNLPRDHEDPVMTVCQETKELTKEILNKFFLVLVRMSTSKESKKDFMSPQYFGTVIYDHFVFDIPRIMDICVIFRPHSPKIVEKMMGNIFKCQKNYLGDLRQSIESIMTTMERVVDRVDVLVQMSANRSEEQVNELKDLSSYLLDITITLDSFLSSYPPGCLAFYECRFVPKFGNFYQNVIVSLVRFLSRLSMSDALDKSESESLQVKLAKSRQTSVNIVRQLVNSICLGSIFDCDSATRVENLEHFFDILSACLSEGTLIVDYVKLFPVQDDIDIFTQLAVDVDFTRVEYLLGGIISLRNEMEELASKAEAATAIAAIGKEDAQESGAKGLLASSSSGVAADAGGASSVQDAAKPTKSDIEIESLISQVKDLLPDLGDGFVEAALKYYDYDAEKVLNSLLEENLPPHLMEMDRTTTRQPRPLPEPMAPVRLNVYDNDEFDVNSRDNIDLSKVHKGKRNTFKNAEEMLNDKSDLVGLKDRFAALGIVADEEILTPGAYDADYDDEYDDTYDDNAVGQNEPDAKDELTERRPFVLPRALGGGHIGKTINIDEDSGDEDEDDESVKKNRDFVRNPEEIREERERRRQSQHKGGARAQQHPPNKDVVGKAKGQGQDKQVLINRARKNANKGKGHRAGAERKQAKGMF